VLLRAGPVLQRTVQRNAAVKSHVTSINTTGTADDCSPIRAPGIASPPLVMCTVSVTATLAAMGVEITPLI
jgi:hypothetical protein